MWVKPGAYVAKEPTVKYRGIFLNDEAPSLSNWVHAKFKGTPGTLPANADVPHHWNDVSGLRIGGDFVALPSRLSRTTAVSRS